MSAMISSFVRPSCSLKVGEADLRCRGVEVTLAVSRGVFGGMFRVETGRSCFLIDSSCGIGDGLGERGIMPSDFSAAITL